MLKMKKVLIIISILVLASLAVWFWVKEKDIPLVETVMDGLPFGDNTQLTTGGQRATTDGGNAGTEDSINSAGSKLFQISSTPVAGAIALSRSAGLRQATSTTFVRYVDRATGHIYDADLAMLDKIKISNQTLPKIYEAYFRPDGNAVLMRYLKNDSDTVENLSLTLTPKATSTSIYTTASNLLRGDISSVAVGTGDSLFYALKDTSSIVSSAFNGSKLRTLLNSPFTDWRLVSAGNVLVAHAKASSGSAGYAYTINTSGGTLSKILGPLNGLIAIPNSTGNRVLYSYVGNGTTKLFSKNLTTGAVSEVLPATLAEKCVWSVKKTSILFCGVPTDSPRAGEPDNWYQGMTHFFDRLWIFDTDTQVAEVLAEPKLDIKTDIDVYQPKLSPSEDYLIFTNRNDLSLWALRLE